MRRLRGLNLDDIHQRLYKIFPIILAMLTGLIFLKMNELPLKWFVAIFISFFLMISIIVSGKVESILMGLLIFTLPFKIDQILISFPYMGGSSGLRIALTDIILVVLCINYLWKRELNLKLRINLVKNIFIPWVLIFFISFISFVFAEFPLSGLGLLSEMIRCYAIFIVVANYFTNKKRIIRALMLLSIGVIVQGLIALIQYQGAFLIEGLGVFGQSQELYREAWQATGQIRPGGTLGGPNDLARYLVLILPVICGLVIYKFRSLLGVLASVAFGFGCIGLVLTFSRIAWAALLIGVSSLCLLAFKRFKKVKILSTSAIVFIILSLIIFFSSSLIKQRLFSDDYGTAYARIPMMKNCLYVISANPLFGVGINNYCAAVFNYDISGIYKIMGNVHPVHNTILLHFAETGIMGGLVYCWLWLACFILVLHCYQQQDRFLSFLASGVLSGMVADFFFHQVQWGYFEGYLPFWIILGLCLGVTKKAQDRKTE